MVRNNIEHYFSEKQTSPLKIKEIKAVLRNKEFCFLVAPGVFSKKKVDKGTEVLINHCIIKDNWNVLDLGCGYGAVGTTIATLFPSCKVLLTDINNRALILAKKNIEKYKCKNAKVKKSDFFSNIKAKFDTILLNPPQTAGKKICEKLVKESINHLSPKGLFQMVARHSKGGKSLSKVIEESYGNLQILAKKSGYRVYVGNLK